jgi:hypothetical protein
MPHLTKDECIELFASLTSMEHDLIHFPYARFSGSFNLYQQNEVVKRMLECIRVMQKKLSDRLMEGD